jgi:hypothetical protein
MAKSTTHADGIMATLTILGADQKSVDAETLTVACFKAFPSLFSMDLFKEYPRIDRVKNRIKDLLHSNLIVEYKNSFYRLTEKGKEWGSKNTELVRRAGQLLSAEGMKVTCSQNMGVDEVEREKKKFIKTAAYNKFKKNKNEITIMDFMDFLKLDIYSTKQLFERKVKRIKAICLMDEELKKLFLFMSKKFGEDYTSFKNEIDKLIG